MGALEGGTGHLPESGLLDDETRTDALDALGDLLHWRLAPQRWERVGQILEALARAFAEGDIDTFREATTDLELAGPVRITRIGATPLTPAPEPVRDRANHLVHAIGGVSPTGQAASAGPTLPADQVERSDPGDGSGGSGRRGGANSPG